MTKTIALKKTSIQVEETIKKDRLLAKLGNKYIPLKFRDIAYFYMDEIVFARDFKGHTYPLNISLLNIEKQVSEDLFFFRANRQTLVNIESIDYLTAYKPGQLLLKVIPKFEKTILLSQERSNALKVLANANSLKT